MNNTKFINQFVIIGSETEIACFLVEAIKVGWHFLDTDLTFNPLQKTIYFFDKGVYMKVNQYQVNTKVFSLSTLQGWRDAVDELLPEYDITPFRVTVKKSHFINGLEKSITYKVTRIGFGTYTIQDDLGVHRTFPERAFNIIQTEKAQEPVIEEKHPRVLEWEKALEGLNQAFYNTWNNVR